MRGTRCVSWPSQTFWTRPLMDRAMQTRHRLDWLETPLFSAFQPLRSRRDSRHTIRLHALVGKLRCLNIGEHRRQHSALFVESGLFTAYVEVVCQSLAGYNNNLTNCPQGHGGTKLIH